MISYQRKYLKYKNKYLKLKKQIGAGIDKTITGRQINKLEPDRGNNFSELRKFTNSIATHPDIKRLGATKIVSTPNSGGNDEQDGPDVLLQKWDALNPQNKNFVTKFWFPNFRGVELGVHVDRESRINNIFLFSRSY